MSKQKLLYVSILTLLTLLLTSGMILATDPGWPNPPTGEEANQPEAWEAWAADNGEIWMCAKTDSPNYTVSGGLAYYTMPNPDDGYMWRLLVVKAGTVNTLYWDPEAGESYPSDRDSISHVIRCQMELPYVPLEAEKTAEGSYDRTVTWELEKSVDLGTHTGYAGQEAGTSIWTVIATKNESLSNYKVEGEITVTNPNNIPVDFSISDTLNDGTVADVICPAYTVPANDSIICFYEATPVGDIATKNIAVVTSLTDGVDGATAEKTFTFEENLIGYDEGTLSDPRVDYSEEINGTTTKTFPETFTCPADTSLYVNGIYEFTEVNWAYLNDNINLSASAQVDVTCSLPALAVEKTAEGAYDRTVEWTLTKSVDPGSYIGYAGQVAGSSIWTVVATKSETLDNYKVTGTISIYNPAAIAQAFTVSDVLDDSTVASVTCPSYTVPAGGIVVCEYTASPTGVTATLNTATVAAQGNEPQVATDEIEWTENLEGYDSGTLSDPRVNYSEVINETTTKPFPETFTCPADTSLYVNGEYSFIETNTATLNGNINLEASADVEVTCYLKALEVEKTADGEWDRTVTWDLEKFVDPASHSGHPGDSFDSIWTVVATKDDSGPQNFRVTGKIEIYNPASIAQSFSIVDELDDGTTATVTCAVNVVNPGETVECTYVAYPNDASATLNTATVAAAGNEPQVATDAVEWTENLEGYDSGTLSDPRVNYSDVINETTTKTFPETFLCPADTSLYVNGIYEFTEVNWAYLNDSIHLSASADVDVTCYLPCEWIGETAWADGERYTSRGNWATYTPYVPDSTVKLYAGQTMEAGTVHFSNAVDGKVTITIQLYEGWRFEDVAENVKIQDYAKAPSGNPAPGRFAHKGYADPNQSSFSIVVPENKFYGVHVNVEWEKCDFPLALQETKSADNTRFLFLPLTTR